MPERSNHIRWFDDLRSGEVPGGIAEAIRWYGTFPDPAARDLPYLAPSHLRRAEIYEALGDRGRAAFH